MVCLEDLVTFVTRGKPSLVPEAPSAGGAAGSPSAAPFPGGGTAEDGRGQAPEAAGGTVSSSFGSEPMAYELSSTGGRRRGGGGGGDGGRLHGDVRWAFMCLLDSLFFSVKEPVVGLDRHPAIHALLDSLLAVSCKLRTALEVKLLVPFLELLYEVHDC